MGKLQAAMIAAESGIQASECACNKCASMCKNAPCIGTPVEMLQLAVIKPEAVCMTEVRYPELVNWFGIKSLGIVGMAWDEVRGCCAMLSKDDKCMLHAADLKPSGGMLASCKINRINRGQIPPDFLILKKWLPLQGVFNELEEEYNKKHNIHNGTK